MSTSVGLNACHATLNSIKMSNTKTVNVSESEFAMLTLRLLGWGGT